MTCKVGSRYRTWLGWRRLLDRPDVSELLEAVPDDVAHKVTVDVIAKVRPYMVFLLERWQYALWAEVQKRAACLGVRPRKGVIMLTSAFRPVGTAAGNWLFKDPCGVLDAGGLYGHWSGWAVDVAVNYTRKTFYPIPSAVEVVACAKAVGLENFYWSEWRQHFAVRPDLIKRYEAGDITV